MRLKRFLMASALALSFTVSAPAVAKADPITAAIVTWAGFTAGTTAFAVATFVVNSALYAAGSWVVTKAAKALGLMKSNVAERQASVTTLSLGETPREAVVGIACVGGSLIDGWNHGGKYGTDYVTRRVALADHILDGLIGYYVDDTYYPFYANGVQSGFNGALQLTFVNATRDGTFPPPYMLQAGVGLTSADRCPSVSEIWITYKFDDQVWTRGHPGLKFVVRGLRVYDPRFDPQHGYTGSSPQTWGDVSSHRFSENAAVVRYNIQRGVYAVGHHGELQHLLIGRGLSADEAPAARIIAAANVCDEIVDGRPRYTVGGAISSAQAHIEVEEMFAAAMAGQIVQRDGGVEVEPGQAKAAVVTITDADLVAGEAISFDEFTPDTDGGRVNTVIARYVEPSQLYKDHSGAVLRDQADIVEDGGPRELTLPLMLVTNKGQADRCAEITRRGARLERRARIALVPMLLAGRASAELEDGDIIAWQSNRYHEGATVRYRIEAYGVDEGWRNTLQLREMASSVFGQTDPVEDRAAPPPPPTPIDALQLLGVQAEAITLAGETSAVPAVRFSWDVTTADTAMTAIRAEVRRVGETDVSPTRIDDVAKGQANATSGVGPDQALECRLVPIGDPSRPVVPSNWITVSTSGLVAGDVSPGAPGLSQIKADIEAAFGDIFDVSELLGDARDLIDAQGVEIAAARGGQPNLNSRIVQVNQARIDGDTSNAEAISLVQARTANTEADIIDLENALATETGARAEAIQQVNASNRNRPNMLVNGSGELGLQGLSCIHIGGGGAVTPLALFSEDTSWGRLIRIGPFGGGTYILEWDAAPAAGSAPFTITGDSVVLGLAAQDRSYFDIQCLDGAGNVLPGGDGDQNPIYGSHDFSSDDTNRNAYAVSFTTPPGTARVRSRYIVEAQNSNPSYIAVRQVKTERGSLPASRYSADASQAVIEASVTDQSLAIIDLENNAAAAGFSKIAEATGSAPAYYEFVSSTSGGYAAIAGPVVALLNTTVGGDPLVALEAIDGRVRFAEPISVIKDGRRATMGPGFGVASDMLLWSGPTSVGFGAETVDNGILGISADDGFFGGKTLSGPFDSGAGSATDIPLTSSYQTVATVTSKQVRNGQFAFWPEFLANGAGELVGTNNYRMWIAWQVVSVDQSNGDAEVITTGVSQRGQVGSSIFADQIYEPPLAPGTSSPGTKRGNRKLLLQARVTAGGPVFVSHGRLRGFYAA